MARLLSHAGASQVFFWHETNINHQTCFNAHDMSLLHLTVGGNMILRECIVWQLHFKVKMTKLLGQILLVYIIYHCRGIVKKVGGLRDDPYFWKDFKILAMLGVFVLHPPTPQS